MLADLPSSLYVLFGLVLTVCGLAAASFGFVSRRNSANTVLQESTIHSLEATITSLQADGTLKAEQIETIRKRCEDLESEVRYLNGRVLQAAKVDDLRAEVGTAKTEILDEIRALGELLAR